MFLELLQNNIMNKQSLLVLNYKELGLNENQVLIVLLIMNLNQSSTFRIQIDFLEKKMNLLAIEIEDELENLITKKLVLLEKNFINLEPLFAQLVLIVEQKYLFEQKNKILSVFQNKITRLVSKNDQTKIDQLSNVKNSAQSFLGIENK